MLSMTVHLLMETKIRPPCSADSGPQKHAPVLHWRLDTEHDTQSCGSGAHQAFVTVVLVHNHTTRSTLWQLEFHSFFNPTQTNSISFNLQLNPNKLN